MRLDNFPDYVKGIYTETSIILDNLKDSPLQNSSNKLQRHLAFSLKEYSILNGAISLVSARSYRRNLSPYEIFTTAALLDRFNSSGLEVQQVLHKR